MSDFLIEFKGRGFYAVQLSKALLPSYHCHGSHQKATIQGLGCYAKIFPLSSSQAQSFSSDLQGLAQGWPLPPLLSGVTPRLRCTATGSGALGSWDAQYLQGIMRLGSGAQRWENKDQNSLFCFGFSHLAFEINR